MNDSSAGVRTRNLRLSDQIHDALASDIAAGVLAPGERLVEMDIAARFKVSQAPVREALRRLAHDGMVLQFPRRGSYVATVDEGAARRAYRVRGALEEVAAREFCRNGEPHDVQNLAGILHLMRDAAERDDLREFIEFDIDFHRSVWEASGSELLVRMWPLVEASFRGFTVVSNRLYYGSLIEIAETHGPLLDSLTKRDEGLAARLFFEHTNSVWERIDSETPTRTEHKEDHTP